MSTTLRCVALVKAASDHPKIISGELPAFNERCGLPLVRATEGPCAVEGCGHPDMSHSKVMIAACIDCEPDFENQVDEHAYLGPWTHDYSGKIYRPGEPELSRDREYGHTPVPESEPVAEETQ